MATPPTINSYHEYTQHLEQALAHIRQLKHLSRKHPFLESLDKQMSRCWNTSVNSNVPDADDRAACAKSIGALTPEALRAPILPAVRALVPLGQACQDYFMKLPLPAGSTPVVKVECPVSLCRFENRAGAEYCTRCGAKLPRVAQPSQGGGWALPSQMLHPDEIVADLRVCIEDSRCLKHLAPESQFFQFLFDQIQIMARFTRESMLPSNEQRGELKLDRISTDDMEQNVALMLDQVVPKLHGFSHLYVTFPT